MNNVLKDIQDTSEMTPTFGYQVIQLLKYMIPLLLALTGALSMIAGAIHFNLFSLILIVSQVYILFIFTYPMINSPDQPVEEHLQLSLPMLWVTFIWCTNAVLHPWIAHTATFSAFLFGLILSMTKPFLQPFIFISAFCLELSLLIDYNISQGETTFHVTLHLLSGLFLPRMIDIGWLKRSVYPRILDPKELPLSHRYFVPNLHPIVKNPSTPNITPPSLDVFSVAVELLQSSPEFVYQARQKGSDPNLEALMYLKEGKSPSGEHAFGLMTQQQAPSSSLSLLASLNRVSINHTQRAIDFLQQSFSVQLDLLRQQLRLDTAAVLWKKPQQGYLGLRAVSSDRQEWICETFPIEFGVLKEALEQPVIFHDPIEAINLVPYYDRRVTLGSFMAVPIFLDHQSEQGDGLLCIDRNTVDPWETGDLRIVKSVAEKLALDIQTSRLLKQLSHDGNLVECLCIGLKKLNETIDLKGVAESAVESIRIHKSTDLILFCVREGEGVRILKAWGNTQDAGQLDEIFFQLGSDSLSQVLHTGQEITSIHHSYTPQQFIALDIEELKSAQAVMIYPLKDLKDDSKIEKIDSTHGAILIASQSSKMLQSPYIEPLRLIMEQIEVKLSLTTAHERLREMVSRDGLTGLKNHMTFQSTTEEMLSRAKRLEQPLALILLDIDHFKKLNDNYGHPFGDLVLKQVAKTLSQDMREVDLVARYGGEEFAIALEATDFEGGFLTAERIRKNIEDLSFDYQGQEVKVSISLGLAIFPHDGDLKDTLIDRSDKALYKAKRRGRNQTAAWRDIASDEQHTSVGWTRHPMALFEVLEEKISADQIQALHENNLELKDLFDTAQNPKVSMSLPEFQDQVKEI